MFKKPNIYLTIGVYVVLAAVTLVTFWPLHSYDFINADDDLYVSNNPPVQAGITLNGLAWAFTTGHCSNWHPLTWLSYMLDCQIFGVDPGWIHLVNVFFHIANSLLLLYLLSAMTGGFWLSFLVAAAFALNPVHVESVAWISERKDVLSTMFWMLTLIAYLRYVKHSSISSFLLTLLLFALGLMAKPMLVTLPFVLLLLDYWPLHRFNPGQKVTIQTGQLGNTAAGEEIAGRNFKFLLWEKLPFFGLTLISSVITFIVQQRGGAVAAISRFPIYARIGNAMVSYVKYLGKIFWPSHLALLYPHPGSQLPLWQIIGAIALLAGISIVVIRLAARRRYLLVGWLWYLGTLVPVIGLVQVGIQAMSDRYTYIPSIGIFIMLFWSLHELLPQGGYRRVGAAVIPAVVVFGMLIYATRLQVSYWQDSITLCSHSIAVTKNNYFMHYNLGGEYRARGQFDEAAAQYRKVLEITPDNFEAHNNLAVTLAMQGKFDEAIHHFKEAIRIDPQQPETYDNLNKAIETKYKKEIYRWRNAIQVDPLDARAQYQLGVALKEMGELDEAIVHFRRALQINPNYSAAQDKLTETVKLREELIKKYQQG